jgi:hypothetical protein
MRYLPFIPPPHNENRAAHTLKHEGIRVGEIIAYRAWRVLEQSWMQRADNCLHRVFRKDYVWDPYRPASGDVREHGIYSFKEVIRCWEEYDYSGAGGPLLFGKVKIWGEIVEHEVGYRSEFARIVSLDDGDYGLLEKFRAIYGLEIAAQSVDQTES